MSKNVTYKLVALCYVRVVVTVRSSASITYTDGKLGHTPGFVSARACIVSLELVPMRLWLGMRTTRTEHHQSRKNVINPMVNDYYTSVILLAIYIPYFLDILSHVILGPSTSSVLIFERGYYFTRPFHDPSGTFSRGISGRISCGRS